MIKAWTCNELLQDKPSSNTRDMNPFLTQDLLSLGFA